MMPKIKILQGVAGLDFSWAPGSELEVSDEEAAVWADGVRAELVPDPVEEYRTRRRAKAAAKAAADKAAQQAAEQAEADARLQAVADAQLEEELADVELAEQGVDQPPTTDDGAAADAGDATTATEDQVHTDEPDTAEPATDEPGAAEPADVDQTKRASAAHTRAEKTANRSRGGGRGDARREVRG